MTLLLVSGWMLTIGAWIFIALVTFKTFLIYGGWRALWAFLLFSSAGALADFLFWLLEGHTDGPTNHYQHRG